MSIRSMTGYAREVFSVRGMDFSMEISSVNQRGFAIFVSAPPEWMPAAERLLTPMIRDSASRGKVSIVIRAGNSHSEVPSEGFSWDEKAVAIVLEKMTNAAKITGITFLPTAEIYLRLAELHRTRQGSMPSLDDEETASVFKKTAKTALENFVKMREREGSNLEKDLQERLVRLIDWVKEIQKASVGTVEHYRDALRIRLSTLGLDVDLDDSRVLKEISIFADRSDISEEITRLESHFSQIETCLAETECGRKLDFICQEVLRELNTIGSKANNTAITRCVVEAKNEQERFREQVQNIE